MVISVRNIDKVMQDRHVELRARVTGIDDDFDLWFRYPGAYRDAVCLSGDSFVAALLMPAMIRGADLHVEGPVSKRLLQGIERFMDVICNWWPQFQRVAVKADEAAPVYSDPGPGWVASSFSGGVDSFHTLLKHGGADVPASERISRLMFIQGFDIPLDDPDFYRTAAARLDDVASACGKELIQVATNARQLARKPVTWGRYHGTVLVAVALGLQAGMQRLYIPSSYPYRDLFPWGSHPLTDPLWSTESLEIVHDGCEATRVQKVVSYIAKSQVALDHLRVCWESHRGEYNCGTCEKCLRTKLNLEIAGVLQKAGALDSTLRYRDIAKMRVYGNHAERFARDNLEGLIAHDCDPRLIKALRKAMSPWSRSGRKYWRKRFTRSIKELVRTGLGLNGNHMSPGHPSR